MRTYPGLLTNAVRSGRRAGRRRNLFWSRSALAHYNSWRGPWGASKRLCYQKMSSARMSRGETLVVVMQPAQDRPTHDLALAPGR